MKSHHFNDRAEQVRQGAGQGHLKRLRKFCAENNNVKISLLQQRNGLRSPTARVAIKEAHKPLVAKL
jgi:hypothetical protein